MYFKLRPLVTALPKTFSNFILDFKKCFDVTKAAYIQLEYAIKV